MMDITESVAAGRRYDVAKEHVSACKSFVDSFEVQMRDEALRAGILSHRIRFAVSSAEKARFIVLRDEALRSLATAERHFVRAQEELAYAQKALELLETELDKKVSDLTIPQPTTHER
jgi:hypothetical protein